MLGPQADGGRSSCTVPNTPRRSRLSVSRANQRSPGRLDRDFRPPGRHHRITCWRDRGRQVSSPGIGRNKYAPLPAIGKKHRAHRACDGRIGDSQLGCFSRSRSWDDGDESGSRDHDEVRGRRRLGVAEGHRRCAGGRRARGAGRGSLGPQRRWGRSCGGIRASARRDGDETDHRPPVPLPHASGENRANH